MTTPTQELCEKLSYAEGLHGVGPLIAKARALIEAQAKRIQQQALEYITIFDQCSEALADRDSWRDQCSQRVEDWSAEHAKVASLEAQLRERGKPIYQIQQAPGRWTDVDKFVFDHWPSDKRIVYAHPADAAAITLRDDPRPDGSRVIPAMAGEKEVARMCLPAAASSDEERRDAERYRFLRTKVVYEGSSDWTIEIWGRYASFEEALDAALIAAAQNCDLDGLVGRYWELAYDEGKTGISHGGEASEVLHAIRCTTKPAAAAREDKLPCDELLASYMCSDEQATQSLARLKTYQWRDTGPLETGDAL